MIGTIACVACGDKLSGVPSAGFLASAPVTDSLSVVRDSALLRSTIIVAGDSVRFAAVTPNFCGRDTIIAGAARDSVVVTVVETELPLPCALIVASIRFDGVVRHLPTPPRTAVLTLSHVNGNNTERSILAVAPRH